MEEQVPQQTGQPTRPQYPSAGNRQQTSQPAQPGSNMPGNTPPRPPQQPPRAPQSSQKPSSGGKKWIWYVLGVIILLLLAGGGYYIYANYFADSEETPEETESVVNKTGILLLTLTPTETGNPNIYGLSLNSGNLVELPLPGIDISATKIHVRDAIAYAALDEDGVVQLYRANTEGGEIAPLTSSGPQFKRDPVAAPRDNRIAYIASDTARESTTDDPRRPEEWTVYVVDTNGIPQEITTGSEPLWSQNGDELLVLKNDGVYLVPIDEPELQQKVIDIPEAYDYMKMALSPKKRTLAISDQFEGLVVDLYNISSWDPFNVQQSGRIGSAASHLAFSPDGTHLALLTGDPVISEDNVATVENERVELINLETLDSESVLDLSGDQYNMGYIWLSDWIE